jgi:hypothetical protein
VDPRGLAREAREKLMFAYDQLSKTDILALPHIAADVVRSRLDEAMADALGLKNDLSTLRKLLGVEPIISMNLP